MNNPIKISSFALSLDANFSDRVILPMTVDPARHVMLQTKRGFDVVTSVLLLILLLPLFIVIGAFIRLGGGPVFYQHRRIGAGGRSFGCLKFRSMDINADRLLADLLARDPAAAAEWSATQKLRNDPRVTAIGKLLRKTSLDELPQLFNVLRGEMSLVGPRPVVQSELRFYGEQAKYYIQARPGVTGLWQISGRSDTSYEQRVSLDVSYVCNWSFGKDLMILLRTVPVVLLRRGAV